MSFQFADLAKNVAADGDVSADELLALRQLGWGDGAIHRHEAEAIFTINHAISDPSDAWVHFFVEALGEFVLNGTAPRGYVDDAEADWLIAALDQDGKLETMAELELLARVMERAGNVSAHLKDYAVDQLEKAVLTGKGPTRGGGELSDTHVTSVECQLLRRFIFAAGGDGPGTASKHEAEVLFRIKDATLGHDNAPEWERVFTDGVANYLQGFGFSDAQLSHSRRKELEEFIADDTVNMGRFFGRMAKAAPQVHNHFGKVFGKKAGGASFAEREVDGSNITDSEQSWLDAQINADGEVDELEKALIERLAKGI